MFQHICVENSFKVKKTCLPKLNVLLRYYYSRDAVHVLTPYSCLTISTAGVFFDKSFSCVWSICNLSLILYLKSQNKYDSSYESILLLEAMYLNFTVWLPAPGLVWKFPHKRKPILCTNNQSELVWHISK